MLNSKRLIRAKNTLETETTANASRLNGENPLVGKKNGERYGRASQS